MTEALRSRRFVLWRALFAADLVLAIKYFGARGENRTPDQGLMSPLLYR